MFNRTKSKIAMLNSKHRKDFGCRYYRLEKIADDTDCHYQMTLISDNAYDREA